MNKVILALLLGAILTGCTVVGNKLLTIEQNNIVIHTKQTLKEEK
jgi:hypothetical protein